MNQYQGIGVSRGIAIGPAFRFDETDLDFERHKIDDPDEELKRLQDAIEQTREELIAVEEQTKKAIGADEAALFHAHRAMLEDPELLDEIRRTIRDEHLNAEAALYDASEVYAETLEALESEYLQARAADVRDVINRVLRSLLGEAHAPTEGLNEPSVILSRDLAPSDTALLEPSVVLGLCTTQGGPTSHTAILARGLGIPAIVAADPKVLDIPEETCLILDGSQGKLIAQPGEDVLEEYRQRKVRQNAIFKQARKQAREPAITKDGHRIEVGANIGDVDGAKSALNAGADGVGLLRTEFIYLDRDTLPDEETQYEAYHAILAAMQDRPVILRTLDIGGDKDLPYLELPEEANPFLGVRALRLCMRHTELFKPQLRAALRAGAGHDLKVMFPMVTTVAEVHEAKAMLQTCRAELKDEGRKPSDQIEIGIMVETPAAALMIDQLAEEVDFFSIGTNDLSQYVMVADRTNANVAAMATGFQPAVLRLVRRVIQTAHDHDRWVGMCGELAAEPLAIPILLGLGLDEFSMTPTAIPLAKQIIRSLSATDAQELADEALNLTDAEEVQEFVRNQVPAADIA